jgi:TusA-related sulfurtransferase
MNQHFNLPSLVTQFLHDRPNSILIDARLLRCPLPALRLTKAIRENPGCSFFLVLATDEAAERDIPALCIEQKWTCELLNNDVDLIVFRVSTS